MQGSSRSEANTLIGQSLRVSVYDSLEALESLRPAWDELLAEVPHPSTFSTWEWLAPWWRAFGHGQELLVLAFRDGSSRLVGLAPLAWQDRRLMKGLRCRVLRLMGDGSEDSDNLDLLARPGSESEVVAALLNYLEGQARRWDFCEFRTMPGDSLAATALISCLNGRGWAVYSCKRPWSVVTFPENWELYLKQLSSEDRKNLERYSRRLQKRYQVRYYKCSEPGQLPDCLDALFHLHQMRWKLRGEPGSFGSPERRQFYYEVASLLLSRDLLEFWLLELDGKKAAAQFAFRHADTVFQLQEGFDPAHASDRVGFLLRGYVLNQLMAHGIRHYDFLFGESPEKARWGAEVRHYINLSFARPFTLGSALLRLADAAGRSKVWARRNAPEELRQALHKIRSRVLGGSRSSAG